MKENVKVIAIVVIAISLFTQTVLQLIQFADYYAAPETAIMPTPPATKSPVDPKLPKTAIFFDAPEWDFGTIKQGDTVSHIYTFMNKGKNDLIIADVQVTCGCTVPFWPKAPVKPGASGEIRVKFNSAGKKGVQHKDVTVIANTIPEKTILKFSATISEPKAPK